MRPIPQSRHLVAGLILTAVAGAVGVAAWHDDRLSDPQHYAAAAALREADPDLFEHDPVLGPSGLWRYQSPAFGKLVGWLLVAAGGDDPSLPFRVGAGPLALVYLLGMYALLFRQTRNWSISVFVAVLSATVVDALGGSFWGVGSLSAVRPAGLCVAVVPLVLLAFLESWSTWGVLLVFACVGALANLHVPTAANLAAVLAIVLLGLRRFARGAWPVAAACVAVAGVAASPYLWHVHDLMRHLRPPGAEADVAVVHQAIEIGRWNVLYPEVLATALKWPVPLFLVILPATVVLYRRERFPVRDFECWIWMIAAVLGVTFLLQGASQVIGIVRRSSPPALGFCQASALAMLPLHVLLAHVLTSLFRLTRSQRNMLRWACGAMAAAWIIPTGSFRVARYWALETATTFMDERSKPRKVHEHRQKRRRHAELVDLGRWAQRKTNPGAVFLFDNSEFRMLSRRALVACGDDLWYVYHFARWRLGAWTRLMARQSLALNRPGGADLADLQQFVSALTRSGPEKGARRPAPATRPAGEPAEPLDGGTFVADSATRERLRGAAEWYVVLPVRGRRAGIGDLTPAYSGEFYCVYRLRGPDPESGPEL